MWDYWNGNPLLGGTPEGVTTTFPVFAPIGRSAVILVEVQLLVVAFVPLKVTAPAVPRLVPVIITVEPTIPAVGDRPVIADPEPSANTT